MGSTWAIEIGMVVADEGHNLEPFSDKERWGADNEPIRATEAGYDEERRLADLKKGEDRMREHTIVFWVRYQAEDEYHITI